MHTIESLAAKLGITLTPHQREMVRAIEWLTAPSVEFEKRGRSLLLSLATLARAANHPTSRIRMMEHSYIIDDSDGFDVWGAVRRMTQGLLDLVRDKTGGLNGDFIVDGNGRVRFVAHLPAATGPSEESRMSEQKIQPGDRVRIKSGGPLMTVESLDTTHAEVVWFDEKENFFQKRVGLTSLEVTSSNTGR